VRRRKGQGDGHDVTTMALAIGYRSSIAASLLRVGGFDDMSDLIGGYQAWAAA
jgi:hydroxyacylglutathione hydrolase